MAASRRLVGHLDANRSETAQPPKQCHFIRWMHHIGSANMVAAISECADSPSLADYSQNCIARYSNIILGRVTKNQMHYFLYQLRLRFSMLLGQPGQYSKRILEVDLVSEPCIQWIIIKINLEPSNLIRRCIRRVRPYQIQ